MSIEVASLFAIKSAIDPSHAFPATEVARHLDQHDGVGSHLTSRGKPGLSAVGKESKRCRRHHSVGGGKSAEVATFLASNDVV
jgi:hypothetical protein